MRLRYAVVYERAPGNFSAYVPELPGCISTGDDWDDIKRMIRKAIAFHIKDLAEQGEPIPTPKMSVGDAMAYHIESLAEAAEPVPDTDTTFGMVEVETQQGASPAATH